jgi:hypothetical protein
LLESDGARHVATGVFLGDRRDIEANGQPGENANGDDLNPEGYPSDEDGVTFVEPISPNQLVAVTVKSSATGLLNAWIDFNADGDFDDAGEQIFTNQPLVAGPNALSFLTPDFTFTAAPRYARFRVTAGAGQGGDTPSGLALNGEVEDYVVPAEPTAVELDYFTSYKLREHGSLGIYVEWKTANEVGTLGFELYRWNRRSREYVIVGYVFPATGPDSTYRLKDDSGASRLRNSYLLREVTSSGYEDLEFENVQVTGALRR